MNFTTPRISEGNATQQYVAVKLSTADTEVDLTPSDHHSRRDSATQLTENNAKNEGGKKTLEEPTQRVELNRVRETNNGTKGSERRAPRAKTSKKVKAL